MKSRQRFEILARQLGYDLTRHDLGFYICNSTTKAWLLYQLMGVEDED